MINQQRRNLLAAALVSGVASSVAGCVTGSQSRSDANALITKPIPVSGERLPVIGIGTNSFTKKELEPLHSVLSRMVELSGVWIDTAAAYGESEAVIGQLLSDLKIRNRVFLATKLVGDGTQRVEGPGALGSEWDGVTGLASFERSLRLLRTDHVDLLQVHSLKGIDTAIPQMLEWKKAGKLRYIGITTSSGAEHAQLLEAMQRWPVDFIQVDYSLANRAAAEEVLPLAQQRRIGVSINLPLGGKRRTLIQEAGDRALPAWAAEFDAGTWAQFFLKYVVSHPVVSCAVPGSTKVNHLEDNQAAARGRLPDAAMRKRMEVFWDAG
ncbi:MAG: aldo/keto reductase [Steroidobacteraceae bacterium]